MNPEERQTVIDALKLGLENTRLSQSEPILKALTIMRRKRQAVGYVYSDSTSGIAIKNAVIDANIPNGTPLYKD